MVGISSIWDKKCYETINWDKIESKTTPHYIHYLGDTTLAMEKKIDKTVKTGLLLGGMVGVGIAAFEIINPLWGVVSAAVSAGIAFYDRYNEEERRRIEEIYNELFPIKGRGYIGVGRRELWMNSAEKLNLFDIGATGSIIDGIAHGFSLFRAQPKEVKEKDMDLKNNLYIAGGPIPNAYSRNVLYGNEIRIPNKFRLDLNERLAKTSPSELKIVRHNKEPNWNICDEEGNEIKGGTPKIKNNILTEDRFMIIKCKNIYPKANKNTKSVIFAGCHGSGTSAAGELIKIKEIIEYIHSKVGDEDFQLIGKVQVNHQSYEGYESEKIGEITKNNIVSIQKLEEYNNF